MVVCLSELSPGASFDFRFCHFVQIFIPRVLAFPLSPGSVLSRSAVPTSARFPNDQR